MHTALILLDGLFATWTVFSVHQDPCNIICLRFISKNEFTWLLKQLNTDLTLTFHSISVPASRVQENAESRHTGSKTALHKCIQRWPVRAQHRLRVFSQTFEFEISAPTVPDESQRSLLWWRIMRLQLAEGHQRRVGSVSTRDLNMRNMWS